MVYVQAAKKTGAYLLVALLLSTAVLTFLSGDLDVTGRVTSTGVAPAAEGASWIIFMLGMFVGALIVGTYVYVAHIEKH